MREYAAATRTNDRCDALLSPGGVLLVHLLHVQYTNITTGDHCTVGEQINRKLAKSSRPCKW